MRLVLIAAVAATVLIVLETALFPFFQMGLLRIDGLCALIAWLGLRSPFSPACLGATLVVSLMACLATALPWQVVPIAYGLGALAASYLSINIMELTFIQKILMVGFVSLLANVIMLAGSGNLELVWPWGILQALLNLVTAPFFLFALDRLFRLSVRIVPLRRSADDQEAI